MAQGLERIPLAVDSDFKAQPVRANFPDAPASDFKLISFEPDQVQAQPAPARMGAGDTLSSLGRNVWDAVVYHTPAAVASAIEGDEPYKTWDWKDALIERARERSKLTSQPGDAQTKTVIPGMTKQDINSLGPSLGFSVAGAGAGLGAGVPAGIAGSMVGTPAAGTVAGYTAGMAASGKAAYNMATNQFVRDLHDAANEEAIRTTGKPVSPEAFAARQAELARVIRDYGLWEAIPEAAGNALGFGVLTAPVKGTIGRLFGNNVATRFASKMGALYGGELATETVTQMGQHNAEVGAGMTKAPRREFTSPTDWRDSFKEVAGPTMLQTTLMAGGFKAGQMAKDRLMGKADQPDNAIPAGDIGAGPGGGGIDGEFIPAGPAPALANQPGGTTYDQSRPELPAGQTMLPRLALPAPEDGGPSERQVSTAIGLLKHSPRASPDLLQRLMRVDQTMATMLFNHWKGQANGQVADSQATEIPAAGNQGQGTDIAGSRVVDGFSDGAVSFTPGAAAEVAAPGGEPGMALGEAGPDAVALAAARPWDQTNRNRRGDEWFEGARANEAAVAGFTDALANGGSNLQAHGMGKERTLGGGIQNLLNMLSNGLDANRGGGLLQTAPLVSRPGEGLVGATASGSAYSDGPFMLVARPGESLTGNLSGLGAVLINQAHADIAPQIAAAIRAIRPDIIVAPYSEAGSVAKQLSSEKVSAGGTAIVTPIDVQAHGAATSPFNARPQPTSANQIPANLFSPTNQPTNQGEANGLQNQGQEAAQEVSSKFDPQGLQPGTPEYEAAFDSWAAGQQESKRSASLEQRRVDGQAAVDKKNGWRKRLVSWFETAKDGDTITTDIEGEEYLVVEKTIKRNGKEIVSKRLVLVGNDVSNDQTIIEYRDGKAYTGPNTSQGIDEFAGWAQAPETDIDSRAASLGKLLEEGIAKVGAGGTALDAAAHQAATSPLNDLPQPTEAQKQAGNYAKGHVRFQGMDISIENPAGSVRSGKDEDGKAWENTLQHHYGYIKGTIGRDKDHLDVFIKPGAQSARTAYVVDQINPKTGKFDEHKIVLGADSEADARAIYQANYAEGWQGMGAITAMPIEQFKDWIKSGKTKKPLAYVEPKGAAHAAKPKAEPPPAAAIDPAAPYGKVGVAPFSSQIVGLKDNVDGTATVMRGDEPFYDFENGDPVTVPTGATAGQIRQAVTDAGALSSRDKWFGVAKAETKPAETGTTPAGSGTEQAKPEAIAGKPVADMPVEQLQKIASGESKTFGSAAVEKASAELARRDEADSPKATKEPWQYGELEYGDKYIDEVVLPDLRKQLANAHGGKFQEYPSKAAAVRGLKERIDTLENHRDAKVRKYYASLDNHYGAVRAALADGKPVPPVAYESYEDLKGDVSAGRIKGDGQEVARVEQPQHIEAGQVEPATAPVIAASLKESAKNTPMNIEQAREWLLSEIDKAIIDAKSAKEEGIWNRADDKVNLEGIMDVGATIGFKTFDVPGDGKFRVLNLKESLQKFKKQVASSPGFKKNATRPMSVANGSGGKTSVRDMLDDGEYVLAADYGHLTGKPLLFGAVRKGEAHPIAYTDAEPVDIKGIEAQVGREWNVTGKSFSWRVIETTTGASVSSESTKEKAISKALAHVDEHGTDKLIAQIKETPKVSQAELERQFTDWGSEEEAKAQKKRDAVERADSEDRALWNSIFPLKDGEKRSPNPWNDIDHMQVVILAKDAAKAGKGDEFVSLIERRRGGTNNMLALAARKALAEAGKPGKQGGGTDYKGFERTPTGNGNFTLKDGNLVVKVEAMGGGKFQASHGSAKSSPHINSEQGAVDWAANLRDASKKTTAYPFYSSNKLFNAEGTAELPKDWTGVAKSDSGKRFFYLGQENGERSFNPLKAESYEDALKEAEGLKNDKPVVPDGYREVARGYFGGTIEKPIYAPFAEGERVRFIGGHAGNIQSFIGGLVTTGAIIKYDNGLTGRAEWRDVEAVKMPSAEQEPKNFKSIDTLNAANNPLGEDDWIRFADGSEWQVKGRMNGWALVQGKTEHPTVKNIMGQVPFIRAVVDANDAAQATKGAEDTALTVKYGGSELDIDLGNPAYQATMDDVEAAVRAKGYSADTNPRTKYDPMQMWRHAHATAVAKAAKDGKPIPARVLYDYRGLIRDDLNDEQADIAADKMVEVFRDTKDYEKAVQAYRDFGRSSETAPTASIAGKPVSEMSDGMLNQIAKSSQPAAEKAKAEVAKRKKPKADPLAAVREFYTPGNIIHVDYWNQYDKVLEFKEGDLPGQWNVKVQQVKKDGDQWVPKDDRMEPPRWHATAPGKDKIVDRVPTQPPSPADAAREDAQDQARRENPDIKTTLAEHDATVDRLRDGTATLAEYKAAFQRLQNSTEELTAEFAAMTKADILKHMGGQRASNYKSDTKDKVVAAAVSDLMDDFSIGRGISYVMGGRDAYANAVRAQVERTTDADLAEYAEHVKSMRAAQTERVAQVKAAMKDPKTLDDFEMYLRAKMAEGDLTLGAARMTMTPEQRVAFDELASEKSRAERKARGDQQRADIRVAAATTEGQIIETKHTKTGEPLFVVKAAERVERDVYNHWNATAKKLGGWYSSYRGGGAVPGFQFKTRENADAFLAFIGGNVEQAKEAVQTRRDAFEDDRSQTAVERLTEMADRLEERADESLNRDRKENTDRRARMAASAEAAANSDKSLAKTMRNIAQAIESGKTKFLDRVRQKAQVEMLRGFLHTAKANELRAKFPSYADQEKHRGAAPTAETADYVDFPRYTAFRSDLATMGRQMLDIDGAKKTGAALLKVADDVSAAYLAFAKEHLHQVSTFKTSAGKGAIFASRDDAETAIKRSGFKGKAVVLPFKRGQNIIIMSPSAAKEAGIWRGDDDKRITLTPDFGEEVVAKVKEFSSHRISMPYLFEGVRAERARLKSIGIETAAELRAALREFMDLRAAPPEVDKIKQMERAMIGRKNDGLDFFPTPASVADELVQAAGIEEGMAVLEPSAGMGHIAERIRAAGVDPDVVEMASDRRELLEAKGFRLVGSDFMDMTPRDFTYGDVFRAPDGTLGVMRGSGGMGSNRVGLDPLDANGNPEPRRMGWYDRDGLEGVEKRAGNSGYDRIIMNPPFSDRRDAEHVRHAYTLLKPGGRLVAIMGEGVFFGQDKKAQAFRDWLEEVGGTSEKLEEGTFLDPSLPVNTGVNARMVVVEKPASDADAEIADRAGGKGMESRRATGPVDVESSAFKRWFGDSKVVDAEGKPLVVYHGTIGDFTEFDLGATDLSPRGDSAGAGFFFTEDAMEAGGYAWTSRQQTGNVMPVYLAITNPYRIDRDSRHTDRVFVKMTNSKADAKQVRRDLLAEGYDGILTHLGEWVAFRPEQIKSAISNAGSFSGTVITESRSRSTGFAPTESTRAIQSIVDKFLKQFAGAADLDIRVVRTVADIPERFRPSPFAEGTFNDDAGLIYLVAMNLKHANGQVNTGRVWQVLMHEAVGHFGLAKMMGARFAGILKQVQQAAKAKGEVTEDTYQPGDADYATIEAVRLRYTNASDEVVAQEVLARMAETDPGRTLFGYVRAVVRQWLRDMARAAGITLDVTTAELNDLVAQASRYMRRGDGVAQGVDVDALGVADMAVGGMASKAEPMTERKFYSQYVQHIDLRGAKNGTALSNREAILRDGFKKGANVNAVPPYQGGKPLSVVEAAYRPRVGDVVYLAPKSAWKHKANGVEIQDGWKPEEYEAIVITDESKSMYENYIDALHKVGAGKTASGGMESRAAPAAGQPKEPRTGILDTILRKAGGELAAKITGPAYDKLTAYLGGKMPEGVKAGMVSDYGLDESYVDRRTGMQTEQQKAARQTKTFVEGLMDLDRAQSRVAYQWLNNRGAEADRLMAQLPPESQQVLKDIKIQIAKLTIEAVRLGQLDAETASRNFLAYLHRSYAKYDLNTDDKTWKAERAKAIKILGDQYKGRGLKMEVDPDRIHSAPGWWKDEMKGKRVKVLKNDAGRFAFVADGTAIPPTLAGYKLEGVWEIRARKADNRIALWRDFTEAERQMMGELDEAKYAVARTLFMMNRDIEVGRFHEWVADEYAKTPEEAEEEGLQMADASDSMMRAFTPDEWVTVPTSKIPGTGVFKFGALAGMVVPGPVWNDIRKISAGRFEPFGAAYASILRAWKLSKTALTPTTHVNNIMGNFVMADMHDVGARDAIAAVRLMVAAANGDKDAKAMLDRFEDSGATQGMFTTHELKKEVLEPLLQQLREEVGMADDEAAILKVSAIMSLALHGQFGEAWAGAKAAAKQSTAGRVTGAVVTKAQDYYQAEDSVFRLAAFLKSVDEGKTDLEAGKLARKAFLDYHINAPWINAMRGTAMPFIAFAYRAIPMLVETAARKPWKIAKYMLVAGGLNALAYAMLGADADEDKERAYLPDEKAGRLWGIVPKLIRMPWNRESKLRDGRTSSDPVFLDVRRWIPVGDVVDYGQDKTALPMIPQPLIPGGPMIMVAEFLVNKSAFTGKELTKETDTWVEKAAKVGGHFYKGFMPNVPIPYSGTWAGTKIDNAVKGKEDPLGRAYPVPEAIASGFGLKLERYPVDTLQRNAVLDMKGKLRELSDAQRQAARDYGRQGMTKRELDEKVTEIVGKKNETVEEYKAKERKAMGR